MKKIFKKSGALIFAAVFLLCGCTEKPDHLALAKEALTRSDFGAAEEEFNLFIKEQEDMPEKGEADGKIKKANISEAYLGIGIARFEQKQYKEARDAFREALKTGGADTPDIRRFTGLCLMGEEKYKEAIECFSEGLRLPSGEAQEGEEEYKAAVREMRLLLIECHEKLRDWKGADKAAARYLEEYPDDGAVKREADFLRTRVMESESTH